MIHLRIAALEADIDHSALLMLKLVNRVADIDGSVIGIGLAELEVLSKCVSFFDELCSDRRAEVDSRFTDGLEGLFTSFGFVDSRHHRFVHIFFLVSLISI